MKSVLAPFALATIEAEPSTVYALTSDLRISYVNPAWTEFARSNRAQWAGEEWGPGRPVLDAVPLVLRPFYDSLFARALDKREVVTHEYDCSSPDEERLFQMRVHPCDSGGLLVVHSPLRVAPRERPTTPGPDALYRSAEGRITLCSHCRRVRRVDEHSSWDWVPRLVEGPQSGTSHGLCRVCAEYYYPG